MKVHLIKKQSIENFVASNSLGRSGFEDWLNRIKHADWNEPSDIIATFNFADMLGNGTDRIVFNIGGNKYRMICEYYFGPKKVHLYICWIGSHAAYSKLCKQGRQYTINIY